MISQDLELILRSHLSSLYDKLTKNLDLIRIYNTLSSNLPPPGGSIITFVDSKKLQEKDNEYIHLYFPLILQNGQPMFYTLPSSLIIGLLEIIKQYRVNSQKESTVSLLTIDSIKAYISILMEELEKNAENLIAIKVRKDQLLSYNYDLGIGIKDYFSTSLELKEYFKNYKDIAKKEIKEVQYNSIKEIIISMISPPRPKSIDKIDIEDRQGLYRSEG